MKDQDRGAKKATVDPVTRLQQRLEKRADLARSVGGYGAIPIMMVVGPIGGWLGGSWLEGRFGFEPWLGVGGLILGCAASVRQVALIMSRAAQSEKARRDQQRGPKP